MRQESEEQPHAQYRHQDTFAYPVGLSSEIGAAAGQRKAG
jgi:hypothetical protein